MKAIKNTKKKFTPAYTVDITNCTDAFDVLVAFGLAKQSAGLAITDDELQAIVDEFGSTTIINECPVTVHVCECKKHIPWYKRLWNRIKRLFTRK